MHRISRASRDELNACIVIAMRCATARFYNAGQNAHVPEPITSEAELLARGQIELPVDMTHVIVGTVWSRAYKWTVGCVAQRVQPACYMLDCSAASGNNECAQSSFHVSKMFSVRHAVYNPIGTAQAQNVSEHCYKSAKTCIIMIKHATNGLLPKPAMRKRKAGIQCIDDFDIKCAPFSLSKSPRSN